MLDLKVQTFLKVCETMNYTKAAEELHLTQPAVTKQIQALEDYYQVKLFQYQNRNLSLTSDGEQLYPALNTLRQDVQKLRSNIQKKETRSRLRIGATLSIGNYSLIECIPGLLSAFPDLDVTLNIADTRILLDALKKNELDLIFCEGNFPKAHYESRLICEVPLAVFCGADYPLGPIHHVSDLLSHTLILREQGSGTRDIFENFLRFSGYTISDFPNYHEVNHTEAILKLLSANMGISVLYENVGAKLVSEGILKKISLEQYHLVHEFNLIWNKSSLPKNQLIPYAAFIQNQLTNLLN